MTSRQEIYDRIRRTSHQEVVLEEMIRLGFWPRDSGVPDDPAEDIRREGELTRQLRALTTENKRLHNVKALKKAARKKRMAESRQRQKETKERRLREREARAAAWQNRKRTEVVYLGDQVSSSLNQQESDRDRLQQLGLPLADNVAQLAHVMETTVAELRFLAFDRRTSAVNHYQRFGIPKKVGGIRKISAPKPRLKRAQLWVLANILEKVAVHDAAHGFRRGRSIVTNAKPHVGSDVVLNVDMEDFFPTIVYPRIRGVFRSLGYSHQVATVLALICSEPDVEEVILDRRTWYVATTERRLPQGAPSSPALTNIICRGLDARLAHNAKELGFTYTRYADDITFSGSGDALEHIGRILRRTEYIVQKEGFRVHPKKTRIFRKSRRQEVTGLVVNERLNVSRRILRRFRATLFQIEKDGPQGKRWGQSPNVLNSIEGFANFVAMVDAENGLALQQRVGQILKTHRGEDPFGDRIRERWQGKIAADSGHAEQTVEPVEPLTEQQPQAEPSRSEKDSASSTQDESVSETRDSRSDRPTQTSESESPVSATDPEKSGTFETTQATGENDWTFTVVPPTQVGPENPPVDTNPNSPDSSELPPARDADESDDAAWWQFWK